MTKNERGSIFFYILIGIALFAALSYAVTQSIRISAGTGGATISTTEKASIDISDVSQFLDSISIRVNSMLISNGISETSLDFKNDIYQLGNNTTNCWNENPTCAASNCHVFSPYATDGLSPIIFSTIADTPEQTDAGRGKNGHGQIRQLSIQGVGTSAPDLVFEIKGVSPAFCNMYNAKQGITTNFTSATNMSDIGETYGDSSPETFGGCTAPSTFNGTHIFGDNATQFAGKRSFCTPTDTNAYDHRLSILHVLKAR